MDIFERLKRDHERQRMLARELSETSGDTPERRELFRRFRRELEAHALAEEQAFYSPLMELPEGTEEARHSVAEHKELDDLVADLASTEMTSGAWLQKFEKLKDRVIHHVDEEEEDVFPLARKLFSKATAEHLAAQFETRKEAESQ